MKKLSYCLFMLLFATKMAVAQQEKPVDSKITAVTVFLNKAQVRREVKSKIEGGKTNLIIQGLTAQLDPNSIQVTGKGNFILLGVSHQQNFLRDFATPKHIEGLNDSVSFLQGKILFESTQKEILNKEEQMLLSNQKIGGANQNLPVTELKNMADFFRSRLKDIAMTRMLHDKKISELNERLSRIQQQIRAQNELPGKHTSEIIVSLSAEKASDVEIVLDYVVANAGWYALYDIRGLNTKTPLSLVYKANVFQGTGETWKNVKLKLSTANPNLGGVKPELLPWFLDFYTPQYDKRKSYLEGRLQGTAPGVAVQKGEVAVEAETIADFVSVLQTSLNTEFEIALPYTINSENKPTTVDIGKHELNASYQYSVAPKLDPDAFLMAGATGWEAFNLLPGEANVFFDGTFVGKSYIDPQSIKDTLYVSLGRDKRIAVKRTQVKDVSSRKFIGTHQKDAFAYEITIRNNKTEDIKILAEDHIPVSKNTQIEVVIGQTTNARYDQATGILVWEFTLRPNESKQLRYDFEVKYPKDKMIAGLN